MDDEPNLVTSGKSRGVVIDGFAFDIEIYRLEEDERWTLEVVDQEGTSHVWNEEFVTDTEAYQAAVSTIESEGAIPFMRGGNVVPFRSL
jgi:hypothetical protein